MVKTIDYLKIRPDSIVFPSPRYIGETGAEKFLYDIGLIIPFFRTGEGQNFWPDKEKIPEYRPGWKKCQSEKEYEKHR